jgi:hypothetical protein
MQHMQLLCQAKLHILPSANPGVYLYAAGSELHANGGF